MSHYTDAVARGLSGLSYVSTGACPGCAECADTFGFKSTDELEAAIESGWSPDTHFSRSACDICGSTLGGDREAWHAVDANGEIIHGDDACVDCIFYLANGDEPEDWGE